MFSSAEFQGNFTCLAMSASMVAPFFTWLKEQGIDHTQACLASSCSFQQVSCLKSNHETYQQYLSDLCVPFDTHNL